MAVQTSAVPATIAALIAACQALTDPGEDLDGVTVIDGPRISDDSDKDRLFIGFDPDDLERIVTGNQTVAGHPGRSRDEEFEIVCLAEAWTGDTAIAARRVRAYQILAAVEKLLRPTVGNHTLGLSNLLWAEISGRQELRQRQATAGAYAGVVFTVHCRARLSIT